MIPACDSQRRSLSRFAVSGCVRFVLGWNHGNVQANVEFNATEVMENGAYQAWGFGPMLLDENGQTMTEFHSSVNVRNPRTAIGYFAPGHYCFVVVDGRSSESRGVTTAELSL